MKCAYFLVAALVVLASFTTAQDPANITVPTSPEPAPDLSTTVLPTTTGGPAPVSTTTSGNETTSTESPTDQPPTGSPSCDKVCNFQGWAFVGGIVLGAALVLVGNFGLAYMRQRRYARR